MSTEQRLRISAERHADGPRLMLVGDLDPATTPELQLAVLAHREPGDRRVVIDLGSVEFIDSAGLRALVETFQTLEADGVDLTLSNPSPIVTRLLQITALDTVIPIEP